MKTTFFLLLLGIATVHGRFTSGKIHASAIYGTGDFKTDPAIRIDDHTIYAYLPTLFNSTLKANTVAPYAGEVVTISGSETVTGDITVGNKLYVNNIASTGGGAILAEGGMAVIGSVIATTNISANAHLKTDSIAPNLQTEIALHANLIPSSPLGLGSPGIPFDIIYTNNVETSAITFPQGSTLDYYQDGTFSLTASGPFVSSQSVTCDFARIGKMVTFVVPQFSGAAGASGTIIQMSTIPLAYRPQRAVKGYCVCMENSTSQHCYYQITTGGVVQISKNPAIVSGLGTTGSNGMYPFSFSYLVA